MTHDKPTPAANFTLTDIAAAQRSVIRHFNGRAVRVELDATGPAAKIIAVAPVDYCADPSAIVPTGPGISLTFGVHADPRRVQRWLRWAGSEASSAPFEVYEVADLELAGRLPRGLSVAQYVVRWAQLVRRDLQDKNPASCLFGYRAGIRRAVEMLADDVRVYLLTRSNAA